MSYQPSRQMLPSEAKALLRGAVKLNILAKKSKQPNRFSRERDEILTDLRAAGHPANVDNYEHPMDV